MFARLPSLIKARLPATTIRRWGSAKSYNFQDQDGWMAERSGNRETVGYGMNGEPEYQDRWDFPFPAIRYSCPSPKFQALREKEKGDWRLLTKNEKKTLYRLNFCQTFSEFTHPTGEWMMVIGYGLIFISIGLWLFALQKLYVYGYKLPKSFKDSWKVEQLRRMLRLKVNPILGLASRWDYEKERWKNKPWYIPWDDPFDDNAVIECEEDDDDD